MPPQADHRVPLARQPRASNYSYNLERTLDAVVGIHCLISSDAFTAETLGVERAGNGVVIGADLVLTIGYLVIEAQSVWIHLSDTRFVEGHVLGIDHDSGLALVQALQPFDIEPLELGDSDAAMIGDNVILAGVGGKACAVASQIMHRDVFAGYWEYQISNAIFTSPLHPNWGGTGLISASGELIGVGSLQIEHGTTEGANMINMSVPINLLKPVLTDLREFGRVNRPARPWLGMYTTQIEDRLVLVGIAPRGPAAKAGIRTGDIVLGINGKAVTDLTDFYRKLWALGPAGTEIPLTLHRGRDDFNVILKSAARTQFLKAPRMH